MSISQAEARRLRKRVTQLEELERQRNQWFAKEYPGIWLCEEDPEPAHLAMIQTARKLSHAVAVR